MERITVKTVASEEVERLRAEVAKRRKAATDKVSRLRRATGVDITGHVNDPRRDSARVKRYNAVQLRSYLGELNDFTSRTTKFTRGANNNLISNKRFEVYKSLETRFNAVGANHEASLKKLNIPTVNQTVEQRDATRRSNMRTAGGDTVQRPYSVRNVEIQNVAGPEALEKLIANMKDRLNRNYLPGQLRKSRFNFQALLSSVGDVSWKDDSGRTATEVAASLTDNQFDILWNYTDVAGLISQKYESNPDVEDNSDNDIIELLEWAKSLPANRTR